MAPSLNVEHTYHETNGIRLHCVEQGPTGGKNEGTIVLLHGFPEFWYCWKNQIPELAVDHRVVAPDMRGYNLSDKPEGAESYKMRSLVEDLLGLLDAIGEEKIDLVAHDWGGAVAWAFAAFHPERLNSLMILNSPHPTVFARDLAENHDQVESTQYMHLLRSERAEELLTRDNCAMLKKFIFDSMADPSQVTEEDRAAYVEAWTQPGAIVGSTNFYRAMPAAPRDLREEQAPDDEDAGDPATIRIPAPVMINVPTLVIWGMKDTALLPTLIEGLEDYVPDLKIERIEEATHWVQHDAPDEVNRAILEFLS